jgi:hypothetical protein
MANALSNRFGGIRDDDAAKTDRAASPGASADAAPESMSARAVPFGETAILSGVSPFKSQVGTFSPFRFAGEKRPAPFWNPK